MKSVVPHLQKAQNSEKDLGEPHELCVLYTKQTEKEKVNLL